MILTCPCGMVSINNHGGLTCDHCGVYMLALPSYFANIADKRYDTSQFVPKVAVVNGAFWFVRVLRIEKGIVDDVYPRIVDTQPIDK